MPPMLTETPAAAAGHESGPPADISHVLNYATLALGLETTVKTASYLAKGARAKGD
jgi:hypothetical protein